MKTDITTELDGPILVTQGRKVYRIHPIEDPRWDKFLELHPRSSVFHSSAWLDSLRRTYDYEPLAYTTSPPGAELRNGVVFCRVNSRVTGRRLVSLPFSDYCEPLVETEDELACLLGASMKDHDLNKTNYIEIRSSDPLRGGLTAFTKADSFCLHQLDLRPSLDQLFYSFHKDCVQRKIRRAQREALECEEKISESLLTRFYSLLVLTRRRHCMPPQPLAWFRNLIAAMGDMLTIRMASKDGQPIAAILTLRHKDKLVYKYGCSDAQFHRLGGMHFLFWKSIQEAKRDGLCLFDLGRSEWTHSGLVTFKDRLGATRSVLEYSRFSPSTSSEGRKALGTDWKLRMAKRVLSRLPDRLLCAAGGAIYRHIG